MNLSLLGRAVNRHRYMKDRPAYTEFLQQISSHQDTWKCTQHDIASWWERRQSASMQLEISGSGILSVSTGLRGAVIEIDGERLEAAPLSIPVPSGLPAGTVRLRLSVGERYIDFLKEVLGHIGYGHIEAVREGSLSDACEAELLPLLSRLHDTSVVHQKYSSDDLEGFRALVASIHHRKQIPELRIWPLPRRERVPYRAAVSTRYDVDKAIINLPAIDELEGRFGLKSTVYLRPAGYFYGKKEITGYIKRGCAQEIALHGEFITTAERYGEDERSAAAREKRLLEDMAGQEVFGICMHGGELRTNSSENTHISAAGAGFQYDTFYRNSYYHPIHTAKDWKVSGLLSMGQHYADITVRPEPDFSERLAGAFLERFDQARSVGGIFVPVLHPLYFDFSAYIIDPKNLFRLLRFFPRYVIELGRMRKGQTYYNS
ncbi:MAG: hypothetical protein JW814_02310 [Candidatus Krumholzibacteriota bacterium]|nr:hypothetical protein [Candidatus Krumholzibacteriota bacterium]